MKRVLIGVLLMGGMAGQSSAQGRVTIQSLDGGHPGNGVVGPLLGGGGDIGLNVPIWGYGPWGATPYWQYAPHWRYYSFYDSSSYLGDYQYPAQPGVAVVTTQPEAPAPPTPPIRPEIHEYQWPSSGNDSGVTTFSVVTKDGRVQSATAVWFQGDELCYFRSDGSKGRMPIDSVDRRATHQRNAAKQLNLSLPTGP